MEAWRESCQALKKLVLQERMETVPSLHINTQKAHKSKHTPHLAKIGRPNANRIYVFCSVSVSFHFGLACLRITQVRGQQDCLSTAPRHSLKTHYMGHVEASVHVSKLQVPSLARAGLASDSRQATMPSRISCLPKTLPKESPASHSCLTAPHSGCLLAWKCTARSHTALHKI